MWAIQITKSISRKCPLALLLAEVTARLFCGDIAKVQMRLMVSRAAAQLFYHANPGGAIRAAEKRKNGSAKQSSARAQMLFATACCTLFGELLRHSRAPTPTQLRKYSFSERIIE